AVERRTEKVVCDWAMAAGRLKLPTGWYRIEFRAKRGETVIATAAVERVGVGEVFVTCGQSNSANYGRPPQRAQDERVSSCDFHTGRWRHGDDPQPGAGGNGGSPWALLGDLLAKKLDVPVGFICLGVGSTAVSFWTPPAGGYARLKKALQLAGGRGVRAVLWHQGESDSIAGTSAENYARMLAKTIVQSREDAGWPVPWGVALAAFHPSPKATAECQRAIVAGQKKVVAEVPGVFQGPETDSFHKRGFLADSVHFNAHGLAAHAQGWAVAIEPLLRTQTAQPR
ncbi:MAG: sialate O-acetylesterase, partial [Verrucomicrobia bacterium]|nr:sialate O-acetylesterase [Verrucomicrobiota bacterium]